MNKFFKAIIIFICSFLLSATSFAGAETVKENIIRQAKEIGVEPAIALSIARAESNFNQNARSRGGHIGVFQLSAHTAKTMGLDPYNLDDNIKGGISYYKNMYDKLGSMELAVAAYNTGLGAVKRNNNKVPERAKPFVNKIMTNYRHYKTMEL